jgi:hypothetical protein
LRSGRFFRIVIPIILYTIGTCLAILLMVEGLLRAREAFFMSSEQAASNRFHAKIGQRIAEFWLNVDQRDPYLPPFLVYRDAGFGDPVRLKTIFDSTPLTPNVNAKSWDFLQDPSRAEQTIYSIHTNSLGFRDPERSQSKPEGTKRIIALGAYHVFGHGVNDDESYPAQLEKFLNQRDDKTKYEVWNGGRDASTAIVGLAHLKNEIFNYAPDLLIIDYGFVDPLVRSDNLMITAMRLPDGRTMAMVKKWLIPLMPILASSYFYNALMNPSSNYKNNILEFSATMSAIEALAREKNVPVIFVQQPQAMIAPHVYTNFIGPRDSYVNVKKLFTQTPPTEEQMRRFTSRPSWLDEAPPALRNNPRALVLAPYQLDVLQLSPLGNKVLARNLANLILEKY